MRFLFLLIFFYSSVSFSEEFSLTIKQKNFLNIIKEFDTDLNHLKELYGEEVYDVGIDIILKNDCSGIPKLQQGFNTNLNIKFFISDLLTQGLCFKQDVKLAMQFMHELADKHDHGPAHHYLYKAYKYGTLNNVRIVEPNLSEYVKYLVNAQRHNIAEAKFNYAEELMNGNLILKNEMEAIQLFEEAARDKNINISKRSYLIIIEYFLKSHIKLLKKSASNADKKLKVNYDNLDIATSYGKECANAGYNECMLYMPVLLGMYRGVKNYNDKMIEGYMWLILSKNFYIKDEIKKTALNIEKDFLNQNIITSQTKYEAIKRAANWIPDGMFRYIN